MNYRAISVEQRINIFGMEKVVVIAEFTGDLNVGLFSQNIHGFITTQADKSLTETCLRAATGKLARRFFKQAY